MASNFVPPIVIKRTLKSFKKYGFPAIFDRFCLAPISRFALVWCHASVFPRQGPSENDFGISSTLPYTQVVTKFSQHGPKMAQDGPKSTQDSPKMTPGCPKMAPEWTQVALKSSKIASRSKLQGPRSKVQGPEGGRRDPEKFAIQYTWYGMVWYDMQWHAM